MPVTPAPIVRADRVSFAYDGALALEDLSFDIEKGAYVGIIGPNGGGKTTLMKLILGLLKPSKGTLSVFGHTPKEARVGGTIGYVPQRITQNDATFPATAQEIVASGQRARRGMFSWPSKEDRLAVENAMELAGVGAYRSRLVGSLSGGERQRVFIARALASGPSMLVLDEPTTGIDPAARECFYALLRRLNETQDIAILFVSHDLEVMSKEADSLLCINRTLVCDCAAHHSLSPTVMERLYGRNVSLIHHDHAHSH